MEQKIKIITISKSQNFSVGSFNNQRFLMHLTDLDTKYLLIPDYINFFLLMIRITYLIEVKYQSTGTSL